MVYCSHSMVFWHIDTLNNYQIITVKKNHLTAVPFNGTCFTEEAGCTCTAQHGSSCGLNCDSPSPKSVLQSSLQVLVKVTQTYLELGSLQIY